ncbi:MAG: Trk family potassium uptake protein [Ruminococcus sp.]|uniref:TrkH family potassium uptake protein n=1 Tax=Ruminococcus sp. TaxID=41978 RepID=UPI0025E77769|nr:potassium transporter TrkG [Ruminococcus sp.]MBO4866258.1 Trk family potassium uptake protein [Ruminococcus sp.]
MGKKKTNKHLNSFQIIIFGFLGMIILGALLLMLPISSQSRAVTPFSDCLFTAVSATCVTGLVVRDTATYWSLFGKAIILLLIQIGGMGVVTMGVTIMRLSGKKIGLAQRSTMQDSISAPQVGGIVKLTGFILKTSLMIELIGAILLLPVFIKDFGVAKGIGYSVWHSISAFCNAGFDLMGVREPFSSLCSYHDNIYLNIVIMLLIIVGGIGFLVWNDVKTHKHHLQKYSLQSKVVLITSLLLTFIPAVFFFFCEYSKLPMGDRIISSLFQSVTTRTAGFNTQDLAAMEGSGTLVMIMLMLVGGSPGSTAGGMKTATLAVLFFSAITVFSRRNDVQCFKRRLPEEAVRNAAAILFTYLTLFITTGIVISRIEDLPILTCLFETGSAVGTVGLTLGITSILSLASRILLMILMFFGRVGPLTLIYAALPSTENVKSKLPMERISVG